MESPIPIPVSDAVTDAISRQARASIIGFTPSVGGCINSGGRLHTTAGDFFLKWNYLDSLGGMFASESKGLGLLRATRTIHIPEVIATKEVDVYQFLLLEYVDRQPAKNDYWAVLGHQLAALHRTHGIDHGLHHDNYIGSIRQTNKQDSSWQRFFISQRLAPLFERAIQTGRAPMTWGGKFEALFRKFDSLLPEEAPSLLHGDLWQGNVLTNSIGEPCLVDPAVYYGHREMDLAMTRLFGQFDTAFYHAYHDAYPLLDGYEERFEIYNLYPLLVHLHLFGSSYVAPIQSILNAFA